MWPLLVFYVALAAAINSTCLLNPPVQISAGSAVSAVINFDSTCEATLMFADNDFPDITFGFEQGGCPQVSILEMTIPPQVPNGDVIIFWKCAGQQVQSCFQANITNGSDDPWNILDKQNGTVRCLNVLSSPVATLATMKGGTTTIETRIEETQIARINTSQALAPSSSTSTSTSAWPHTTLIDTWTALETLTLLPTTSQTSTIPPPIQTSTLSPSNTSALSPATLNSSQTTTLSTSTSVRPVIAKAAKNLPQSCFAMAAVLATVAYT